MHKLLVIGSGGREHALTWALLRSPKVSHVYVAPGNGATASMAKVTNVALSSPTELAKFAKDHDVYLTVVGPEAPLAAGVVDAFQAQGLRIFGPTQACAQLESSKDYAKAFMKRHGIPTAAYETFTDPAAAHAYIDAQGAPIVIKADGLAAGKGVVVATTLDQAHAAVDSMLGDGSLGAAGARVVIEACLTGEEASFIIMADGKHILPLASSQDHKRLGDGDQGPNTGGMGAYSPAPVVSATIHDRIMREVILPTISGMQADGLPYTGFLYAGVMIGDGDDATRSIDVLEFNCRMGDPETQPILMRLRSDLLEALDAAVDGRLNEITLDWDPRTALGVVMASAGYPAKARTGDVITDSGADKDHKDVVVFHAGTSLQDQKLVTSGGRVLCVTALGDTVQAARELAYSRLGSIKFDGAQYRNDIAWRALTS
ncbi:phosphoribosylamine--glycine ligase [Orrella daihaiensis]|uniref:Phosphoribosylamine--glycine ligase n=1 Tax=Orrella daihaiensis TaxID=2782176 RepID=A0ABY4AFX7_9BURK|nr:phosphoribosylamine--glycine ligase [Orrella daihaiensis]UOD49198.1 phosphoribosylamine--glycine ligase [Orrella daihaiensis]